MKIETKNLNNIQAAVVYSDTCIITDTPSALDFMVTIKYETGCDRIVLNKQAVNDAFFILSTGVAGEILQKFVTYGIRFAIYGDFSGYTSKPLKDFIYESNRGRDIFFASDREDALQRLCAAP